MSDEKKPIYWMILFGIVRTFLARYSGEIEWLVGHDTFTWLVAHGIDSIVSWLIFAIPVAWTILQKMQVVGWLKTALHMNASQTPGDVVKNAPGPNLPV